MEKVNVLGINWDEQSDHVSLREINYFHQQKVANLI